MIFKDHTNKIDQKIHLSFVEGHINLDLLKNFIQNLCKDILIREKFVFIIDFKEDKSSLTNEDMLKLQDIGRTAFMKQQSKAHTFFIVKNFDHKLQVFIDEIKYA